eukprot:2745212-Amphidinium_carterae.1
MESAGAAASSSIVAFPEDTHRRQRQGPYDTALQDDTAVVTAGIQQYCGFCEATFCEMHSHHRAVRGQNFLVCSNCVAAHPKRLPKLPPPDKRRKTF